MEQKREFEVGEHMIKNENYNKCMVCLENLKLKEKVVLCAIQAPKLKGKFINAVSIPIHTKCYWIEEEDD